MPSSPSRPRLCCQGKEVQGASSNTRPLVSGASHWVNVQICVEFGAPWSNSRGDQEPAGWAQRAWEPWVCLARRTWEGIHNVASVWSQRGQSQTLLGDTLGRIRDSITSWKIPVWHYKNKYPHEGTLEHEVRTLWHLHVHWASQVAIELWDKSWVSFYLHLGTAVENSAFLIEKWPLHGYTSYCSLKNRISVPWEILVFSYLFSSQIGTDNSWKELICKCQSVSCWHFELKWDIFAWIRSSFASAWTASCLQELQLCFLWSQEIPWLVKLCFP